jgi:hypothetical protein
MNVYVAHHNFNGSTDMGNTDEGIGLLFFYYYYFFNIYGYVFSRIDPFICYDILY